MAIQLKRVERQTIVITGASSGIGLTTAMLAAQRGARVVLAARNATALERTVAQIEAAGGQALAVVADVSDAAQVDRIAAAAIERFGGFDTWVNNASVAIYGTAAEVTLEDHHRLFEVNYFGVVNGCRAALPHLRANGGAIINVGSTLSDRAVPLLGVYAASKHAVKAFTDSLRMDLEREGAPVSVTLIKPGCIDTPFYEHARNYTLSEAQPTQPVYAPEVAAEAILACAERATRDLFVGGGGKAISAIGHWTPGLADRALQPMYESQLSGRPLADAQGNLYEPRDGGRRGRFDGTVHERSLYTAASLNPVATAAVALGVGAAVLAAARMLRSSDDDAADAASLADSRVDHRLDDTLVHGALAIRAPRTGDAAGSGLVAARGFADRGAPVPDSAESAQHVPGGGGGGGDDDDDDDAAGTRTPRSDAGAAADAAISAAAIDPSLRADASGERLTSS